MRTGVEVTCHPQGYIDTVGTYAMKEMLPKDFSTEMFESFVPERLRLKIIP